MTEDGGEGIENIIDVSFSSLLFINTTSNSLIESGCAMFDFGM